MSRKIRQNIIIFLISILVTLGIAEWYLWNIDPTGFRQYLYSSEYLNLVLRTSHPTGTQYYVGHHHLGHYSFTALPDGLRLVPDTGRSDCKITAIGDSLTFGMGVYDHETWVNLLALRYPKVEFINTGRPGYSAANVQASYAYYPSDGYIYMIVGNDDEPFITHDHSKSLPTSLRLVYTFFIGSDRKHARLRLNNLMIG